MNHSYKPPWVLVVLLLVTYLTPPLLAQETTGTITGQVVDTQGLAIPGATITVTGPQGAKTAVTDTNGRFSVPLHFAANYTERSEEFGFIPIERRDVVLRLGQTVDLNLRLDVGGLTETIEVSGSPVIDRTTTTIGTNIDSELLS